MLAVAAMASCAKSELAERPAAAGEVELKFGSAAIETRTPFIGTIDSNNKLTAQVLVSTVTNTYFQSTGTGFYANDTVTFEDEMNAYGFDTPVYYPADGSTLYLVGLYPKDGGDYGSWSYDTAGTYVQHAIDGKTDLMFAEEKTTDKAAAQSGTYPKLSFNHLLTKYVIVTKAENQAAVDAWGKITKIELVKEWNNVDPKNSCMVTFGTPAATPSFSGTGAIKFYLCSGGTTAPTALTVYTDDEIGQKGDSDYITLDPTDAAVSAYAIVAPIEPTDGSDYITLKVYSEKLTAGQEVKVNLKKNSSTPVTGSTAGHTYTITLTFKATELKVEGEVTDWKDGGTGEAEIK